MEFEAILQRVPLEKRGALQEWWAALPERHRARGLQDLAQQYPAPIDITPAQGDNDVLATLGMLGAGTAAVGGTVYGGVKGTQALGRMVARNIGSRNLTRAVSDIEAGGETVDDLIRRVREFGATGRNRLTLSDVSPRFTAEADFVATNDPATRSSLAQLHTERTRQRPTRMIADVNRIAPGGYADPSGLAGQIQAEQRAWAAGPEGYGGLREKFPRLSQGGQTAIVQFLDQPRITRLWQDAQAVGAIGPLPTAEASSFEVMQGFKERLDGLTDAAWARNDGDLGRRLGAARDELVRVMNQYVPGYERVTAQYKRYSDQRRAVEAGQELWREKLQAPEFDRRLSAIPESDRWLVQRGMLGEYLQDVENARTNPATYESWLSELPTQQRKLETAFGGERQFRQALQTYQQELNLARLGSVGTGSQTASRTGRQALAEASAIGEAAHLVANPITGVPTVARRVGSRWIPGAVAREMAPAMAPRSASALEELLLQIARRAPK